MALGRDTRTGAALLEPQRRALGRERVAQPHAIAVRSARPRGRAEADPRDRHGDGLGRSDPQAQVPGRGRHRRRPVARDDPDRNGEGRGGHVRARRRVTAPVPRRQLRPGRAEQRARLLLRDHPRARPRRTSPRDEHLRTGNAVLHAAQGPEAPLHEARLPRDAGRTGAAGGLVPGYEAVARRGAYRSTSSTWIPRSCAIAVSSERMSRPSGTVSSTSWIETSPTMRVESPLMFTSSEASRSATAAT